MPEIEVSFELACECGETLQADPGKYPTDFVVVPCPKCLSVQREEGYNEGYGEAEDA